MKYFKTSFWSFIVAFFAWIGMAHAVDSTLSWTNPTIFTDSSAIPANDLVSNQIFRKVNGGAYSLYKTVPVGTTYVDVNLANGTFCYQVTAVRANGIASGVSNEACKTIDTRIPGPPVITIN